MTIAIHPQEEGRDLEIVEDDLVSAASSAENRPSRRGSRISRSTLHQRKQGQPIRVIEDQDELGNKHSYLTWINMQNQ